MEKQNTTKIWLAQTRANFLILAVFLTLIGVAMAYGYHSALGTKLNLLDAFLVLIGAVLSHASVNLFNEYSDFKTKIDFNTVRNPFSGGSGMLTSGQTKPKSVLGAAIMTLVVSAFIGIYFGIKIHWFIFVLIGMGGFAIVFYTTFLAKILLGEFFAGLTLGTLVVIGAYIVLTANQQTPVASLLPWNLILISIPPGILTALLLFLNEFPDADADKEGGRYHLVIKLGKKNSAVVYVVFLALTYTTIIITPLMHLTSFWVYLALLTIPLAFKAGTSTMKNAESIEKMIPLLGINVMIVLGTDLLLAAGVFIQTVIR